MLARGHSFLYFSFTLIAVGFVSGCSSFNETPSTQLANRLAAAIAAEVGDDVAQSGADSVSNSKGIVSRFSRAVRVKSSRVRAAHEKYRARSVGEDTEDTRTDAEKQFADEVITDIAEPFIAGMIEAIAELNLSTEQASEVIEATGLVAKVLTDDATDLVQFSESEALDLPAIGAEAAIDGMGEHLNADLLDDYAAALAKSFSYCGSPCDTAEGAEFVMGVFGESVTAALGDVSVEGFDSSNIMDFATHFSGGLVVAAADFENFSDEEMRALLGTASESVTSRLADAGIPADVLDDAASQILNQGFVGYFAEVFEPSEAALFLGPVTEKCLAGLADSGLDAAAVATFAAGPMLEGFFDTFADPDMATFFAGDFPFVEIQSGVFAGAAGALSDDALVDLAGSFSSAFSGHLTDFSMDGGAAQNLIGEMMAEMATVASDIELPADKLASLAGEYLEHAVAGLEGNDNFEGLAGSLMAAGVAFGAQFIDANDADSLGAFQAIVLSAMNDGAQDAGANFATMFSEEERADLFGEVFEAYGISDSVIADVAEYISDYNPANAPPVIDGAVFSNPPLGEGTGGIQFGDLVESVNAPMNGTSLTGTNID